MLARNAPGCAAVHYPGLQAKTPPAFAPNSVQLRLIVKEFVIRSIGIIRCLHKVFLDENHIFRAGIQIYIGVKGARRGNQLVTRRQVAVLCSYGSNRRPHQSIPVRKNRFLIRGPRYATRNFDMTGVAGPDAGNYVISPLHIPRKLCYLLG